MILAIDLSSDTPVYRQIVDAVRPLLVDGSLAAGDLLPPVRQLAADLGVHFNTVAEAYRLLADEGWLELRRGRGAAVVDRQTPPADGAALDRFSRRVRELVAEARSAGVPAATVRAALEQVQEGLEP